MARFRRYQQATYFSGRSKPRVATMPGVCAGCGKNFDPGDMICFDGIPWAKARYHAECESVETAHPDAARLRHETQIPETRTFEPEPETSASETGGPETTPRTVETRSFDALIDARIAEALGDFKPAEAVTADRARTLVDEAIARSMTEDSIRALVAKLVAPVTVKLEIKVPGAAQVERKGAHYLYPRLLGLIAAGFNVYVWGPAGTGKTTAALDASEDLKRKGEVDTLDPTTFKSAILGFMSAAGKPVHTSFTRCYEGGGIYIADECDAAPANVQTLFNSALANGTAPTAWGNIDRHKRFGFVGTGNSPGRPTPEHPDRKVMSAAFKDRLYFLYWPLDPAIECRAAGLPIPPPPTREVYTCTAAEWVTWVRTVRAWASKYAPTIHVSQRASLAGLEALKAGETPEEVAHGLVFRGADETLINKALAACPLPGKEVAP